MKIDKFIDKHYNLIDCTRAKLKTVLREYAKIYHEKHLNDIISILPTEKEIDEWFTYRSENPPYTNIKKRLAIEGAMKYKAILLQRFKLKIWK